MDCVENILPPTAQPPAVLAPYCYTGQGDSFIQLLYHLSAGCVCWVLYYIAFKFACLLLNLLQLDTLGQNFKSKVWLKKKRKKD